MKAEIRQRWVEALRSGEYEQTRDALHDEGGFCVLGVLCDLHAKEHGAAWEPVEDDATEYWGEQSILPKAVAHWAGLDNRCGGNVTIGWDDLVLTEHNDNGRTFTELANAIEAQL